MGAPGPPPAPKSATAGEVHLTFERRRFQPSPLGSSLETVEAALIRQTLERVTSNRREAAAVLGISVRSLQYKIKSYGIGSR